MFLALCHGQGQRLEAAFARGHGPDSADHVGHGGVESHLAAVEFVAFESQFHGGRTVMAGDADEARELLVARLEKGFENATLGLNAGQVVFVFEGVDVNQIHPVHLQILQALLDDTWHGGAIPGADLGGDEEALLSAPRPKGPAEQLLAAAVIVAVGGIEVSDARVGGLDDEAHRVLLVAGLVEALTPAESQNGDALAGLSQLAHWHLGPGSGKRSGNARPGSGSLHELTS